MKSLLFNLTDWQAAAVYSPYKHTAFFGGVATGKSFSLAHFDIRMFLERPDVPGFIGANSYDQLNQATLKELFFWLEHYGVDFTIHKKPPEDWGQPSLSLPRYHNVISVKAGNKKVACAFTRILSQADPLRGLQFGWYSIDETRDTPQDTHDVLLSRMRRYEDPCGLIGTTTNGEDWAFKRFACAPRDQRLYGSLHVPTTESVKAGIVTQDYLNTMLSSYTELMAEQEIYAKHVNVMGGRAYYSFGEHNRRYVAPWGVVSPDPSYPLIVGCDFNFDPSPLVWMIGQVSPDGESIHWFDELSRARTSTPEMTYLLMSRYPNFHYRIFGDRSGMRGTTSNAGRHDYQQMAEVLGSEGCFFTMDTDQGQNPLVKNRVENMNRMAKDAVGVTRMTYNPQRCPLFDADVKLTGWRMSTQTGRGKLDDGGDKQRTHAADGAGYAVWKLFKPGLRAMLVSPTESQRGYLLSHEEA